MTRSATIERRGGVAGVCDVVERWPGAKAAAARGRRIVVFNADDYGQSEAGNEAIREVLSAGIVRSMTVLANGPCVEEAADVWREFPGVSVGVHLNLTEGEPVLRAEKVRTLVDGEGRFLPGRLLLRRCVMGRVNAQEVFEELVSQVVRVAALVGKPTHLDSHQNVHGYPAVLQALFSVCGATGVSRVRSQTVFHPEWDRATRPHGGRRRMREWFKVHQEGRMRRRGLGGPDRLMPYAPGYSGDGSHVSEMLTWWRRAAAVMPEGITEVVTHPGTGRDEAAFYRLDELRLILAEAGIDVASYGEL